MTDAEQIAAFIAARGVVRCPTAIVAPTPGVAIPAADRATLTAYQDASAATRAEEYRLRRERGMVRRQGLRPKTDG